MTPKRQRNTTLGNISEEQIARLQEIAKELEYVAKVGSGRGNGSVSALVRAIADGKLVITKANRQGEDEEE